MVVGGIAKNLNIYLLNFPNIGYFLCPMTNFYYKLCPFPLKRSTQLVVG